MPEQNPNVARMVITPSHSTGFVIEEWQDLPVSVQNRFPELREWNAVMKERFERMQTKTVDLVRAIQLSEG